MNRLSKYIMSFFFQNSTQISWLKSPIPKSLKIIFFSFINSLRYNMIILGEKKKRKEDDTAWVSLKIEKTYHNVYVHYMTYQNVYVLVCDIKLVTYQHVYVLYSFLPFLFFESTINIYCKKLLDSLILKVT